MSATCSTWPAKRSTGSNAARVLEYDADEDVRLALTHLIQTLGEAARRVSLSFQEAHPDIPWRHIIGMRHKVVHDYLEVDYDLVWDVVTAELPPLVRELERFLPPEPSDPGS